MNDGEKMNEKEMTQENLETMKKNAMKVIVGKKLKVRIMLVGRALQEIGSSDASAVVDNVEESGVVFDEENGTRFFVLFKDMGVDIGMKNILGSSIDTKIDEQIKITVQNAVID